VCVCVCVLMCMHSGGCVCARACMLGLGADVCACEQRGDARAQSRRTCLGSVGSRLAGGQTCPWDVDLRRSGSACTLHTLALGGAGRHARRMRPHGERSHAIAREPIDRRTYIGKVGSCWGARDHGVESCVRWCTLVPCMADGPCGLSSPTPPAPCLQLSPGPPRAWFGVPHTCATRP
jgi:hypothetical protein